MIISVFLIGLVCGEVRINEVMAKTPRAIYGDVGCEWIEIYSTSTENLDDWIINTPGHDLTINYFITDFLIITGNKSCFKDNWGEINESKIIEWSAISLNDAGDNVSIFNNESQLIDNINYPGLGVSESLQYCSNEWIEKNPTPGSENNCTIPDDGNNDNSDDDPEISISMEWDEDDIINGEEFDIEITVENLDEDENYDIKVWIETDDDDEDRISQTYDENDDWVSSNQYYNDFFEKEIDDDKDITLRIHEDFDDFFDDAIIYLRIREAGKSDYIKEIDEDIEILEPEEESESDDDDETTVSTNLPAPITGQVIRLGSSSSDSEIMESKTNTKSEDIKTKGNMIYQSKTEYIKKYSIFGFALLCVGLSVFLVFKKI